jgi:hypothetical protein
MKKPLLFLLVGLMVVGILVFRSCSVGERFFNNRNRSTNSNPASQRDRDHEFDRRVSLLEYTRHARCRMDCRHITEAEVRDVMQTGEINYRKSEADEKPCPVYALEGSVNNTRLRIVFAQCDQKTKVVTVIDLDREWQCDCPGDESKH